MQSCLRFAVVLHRPVDKIIIGKELNVYKISNFKNIKMLNIILYLP